MLLHIFLLKILQAGLLLVSSDSGMDEAGLFLSYLFCVLRY